MSTTEKTPAVATQDLPADEAEIARKAVASTVCPACFEQEEIRDLENEIHSTRVNMDRVNSELISTKSELKRSREELRLANIELRKSEERLEGANAALDKLHDTYQLQKMADQLNWLMASNKDSFIAVYESFRTTVATYFLVKEKDGHPVLHFMDNSNHYMPPQALANLDATKFRLARTGIDVIFEETKNADD